MHGLVITFAWMNAVQEDSLKVLIRLFFTQNCIFAKEKISLEAACTIRKS
jgi:hypothetical protein